MKNLSNVNSGEIMLGDDDEGELENVGLQKSSESDMDTSSDDYSELDSDEEEIGDQNIHSENYDNDIESDPKYLITLTSRNFCYKANYIKELMSLTRKYYL